MKEFNKKALQVIAFIPRSIYEWTLELFYVRITNSEVYHEKSGTKAFLTFMRLLTLIIIGLIAVAFWIKLGGKVLYIENEAVIRKTLTTGILAAFSGLGTVIGILLGFLQNNYTNHKKQVVEAFKK